jgi:hypothetical protein
MKRVLRIERGKPPREMQFSDQMWEEIRKLKIGGVEWELLPDLPPIKAKAPELPIVMEYMAVKTIDELPEEVIEPKLKEPSMVSISFTSQPLPKEKKRRAKAKTRTKSKVTKDEATTVRKRRAATKRV